MTTYATNNPLGSTDPRDLYDNSQNFDHLSLDRENETWPDRLGNDRLTWHGIEKMSTEAISAYGWITLDSFQSGQTLTLPNQALRWALPDGDGEYYRWDGEFPVGGKIVPPASTPASTGGVGPGAWVSVGDAALRSQLSAAGGVNYVNGAVKNVPYFSNLKNGRHGLAEVVMTIEHHAGGLGGASYRRSGTTGTPSSGNEALVFDADGVGWKMVKQPIQSARAFGILGNGVDDRAAIQLGADFVGQNGGGVLYVESLNGFNDVELGDSLTITFSGVEIRLGDGVHVHTELATPNKGYCIGFSGSLTSESGRIKGVGIRGGSVSANGSGNLDNAIGFAGCEDFYAEDIYIPNADRKAVTAQVNVVNGRFKNIRIGTTGYDAVSIEGDTLNHTIRSRNFVIEDITIESAGRDGVNCSGDSDTQHTDRITIKNVRVNIATRNGMTLTQCDNVYVDPDTRINNCGGYGISFASCLEVSGGAQILNTQSASLVMVSCNRLKFDARITNAGLSGTGINDAIYINTSLSPHFVRATVYGSTHRYLFSNAGTDSGHVITFPSRAYMPTGTAGLFSGTITTVNVEAPDMPTITTAANPNVMGYSSFILSPTSAFTMTTMTGGLPGKFVTIQFNGSVTVAHGTTPGTIRLKGATNVTPVAGSIMMFSYTSEGLWREVSRNF